jgi:hypothetical protein
MFRSALLVLVVALFAGTALAAEPTVEKNIPEFLARQAALRQDLTQGSKFSYMDNQTKQKVIGAQDVLFRILANKKSIDELNQQERVDVYNAQTEIAAILDDATADRPVCENHPKMGSHLHQVECVSRRERDEQHDRWHSKLLETRACTGALCTSGG